MFRNAGFNKHPGVVNFIISTFSKEEESTGRLFSFETKEIPFSIRFIDTKALLSFLLRDLPHSYHAETEENPRSLDWEGSLNVLVLRSPRKYPRLWNQ